MDAVVDAAQNVQGVVVEQWCGRSVMNSFHALWSVGAATGGAAASRPVEHDVDSVRAGGPDREGRERGATRGHAYRLLVPLVALAIAGALVEDVVGNWAALHLVREAGAAPGVAGLGLTVALGAQFVGRLLGDPMSDRWGRAVIARTGGLLVAVGGVLVVLGPSAPWILAGFATAGFGCATLVPAAFAAAARIPGLPHGTGVALLGWLMRIGFLVTSPVVGWISRWTDLRTALVVMVIAGVAAAAVAHTHVRTAKAPT